ncbi:MAG: hypothetical protein J7L35_10625 [Anaerolineales bacterium]|nr:hypothetical protein [Anaerolineales bacterium]
MVRQLQLIIRLLKDKRVHPLIKVLPFLSLIYLIYPDFIPGPFDDAVVIGLFTQFFMSLVPDDLVDEHRYEQEAEKIKTNQEDSIIEGEFWEE